MSMLTYVTVRCDKCGIPLTGDQDDKARIVRATAKAKGWKLGKQKDFCPICKEAIAEQIKQLQSIGELS